LQGYTYIALKCSLTVTGIKKITEHEQAISIDNQSQGLLTYDLIFIGIFIKNVLVF
jgi:hypothetical protein